MISAGQLNHARDLKARFFQKRADFTWLIALHFDATIPQRAAGSHGAAQIPGKLLQGCVAQRRGKVMDDDDSLATAVRGFTPKDHTTQFLGLRVRG